MPEQTSNGSALESGASTDQRRRYVWQRQAEHLADSSPRVTGSWDRPAPAAQLGDKPKATSVGHRAGGRGGRGLAEVGHGQGRAQLQPARQRRPRPSAGTAGGAGWSLRRRSPDFFNRLSDARLPLSAGRSAEMGARAHSVTDNPDVAPDRPASRAAERGPTMRAVPPRSQTTAAVRATGSPACPVSHPGARRFHHPWCG